MLVEHMVCILLAMSIVRISDSSPSGLATDGSRRTDVDRQVLQVNDSDTVAMKISDSVTVKSSDSTVLKSSDSMVGRILNVLECLMKPSDKGGDVMRVACHEVYSSVWKSARHALLGDDNEIGESKKSKKKQWDIQTLMLGAGVKLILFLPVLAILTGKAISLSLMSLLITSLGFLYKNQLDSFAKRSGSL